jgi:hypothetical protein
LFFSSFKIIRKKIIFQSKICCCLLAGAQRHRRQLKSLNNQTKNLNDDFFNFLIISLKKILCCCATISCLFSRRIIWAYRRYIIYYIMTSMDEKDNAIWQLSKRTSSQSQYTFSFYMFLYMASIFKTVICLYRAACIMMCLERPS